MSLTTAVEIPTVLVGVAGIPPTPTPTRTLDIRDYCTVIGDEVDYTSAFLAAMADMRNGWAIKLFPGTFHIDPDTVKLKHVHDGADTTVANVPAGMFCDGGTARIRPTGAGSWLIADERYVSNSVYPIGPWRFENIEFDGENLVDRVFIWRGYQGRWTRCRFLRPLIDNFLFTLTAADGTTTVSSYLSECYWVHNSFAAGSDQTGSLFRTYSANSGKPADGWFIGNSLNGLSVDTGVATAPYGMWFEDLAGWHVRQNHVYECVTADARIDLAGNWATWENYVKGKTIFLGETFDHGATPSLNLRFQESWTDVPTRTSRPAQRYRALSGQTEDLVIVSDSSGDERLQVSKDGGIRLRSDDLFDPLQVTRFSSTGAPYLSLRRSRSDTIGTNEILQSGDSIGRLAWYAADGDGNESYVLAAAIQAVVDGTPGADDMPGALRFRTTSDGAADVTTRMVIDSANKVLPGTDDTQSLGSVTTRWSEVHATKARVASTVDFDPVRVTRYSSSGMPWITLRRSASDTLGTGTAVASGDGLGALAVYGADGASDGSFIQAARIQFAVDGTPGTSDMPGRMSIWTTPDGASEPVERVRVDSSGRVILGGASGAQILSGTGSPAGVVSAPVGSLYLRTDGGAGSTLYIKESGTGTSGWAAK